MGRPRPCRRGHRATVPTNSNCRAARGGSTAGPLRAVAAGWGRPPGGPFAGDGDVLATNVAGTSITASYNAATETLTLSGTDTLAHYQQVLDSVTFSSGINPSNGNLNRTRTVTWVVNDGSGSNNLTHTATTPIALGD